MSWAPLEVSIVTSPADQERLEKLHAEGKLASVDNAPTARQLEDLKPEPERIVSVKAQGYNDDDEPVGDPIELSDVINLPDIADVKGPGIIGAFGKPKRKRYTYKGTQLSRKPMKFEATFLDLTGIPARLDDAVLKLSAHSALLQDERRVVMQDIAAYGAGQVLRELVRQGAREDLQTLPVPIDIAPVWDSLVTDRRRELTSIREIIERKLLLRRIPTDLVPAWTDDLLERRRPALEKRYNNRAVNDAFAYGRAAAIKLFQRQRKPINLASIRDEDGKWISVADAVNEGLLTVDVVVHTAVMDLSTCAACEDVDGEEMDFGSKRQKALRPPYVKCFGGDHCRCMHIALLSNGMEIDVDEIDEDLD